MTNYIPPEFDNTRSFFSSSHNLFCILFIWIYSNELSVNYSMIFLLLINTSWGLLTPGSPLVVTVWLLKAVTMPRGGEGCWGGIYYFGRIFELCRRYYLVCNMLVYLFFTKIPSCVSKTCCLPMNYSFLVNLRDVGSSPIN